MSTIDELNSLHLSIPFFLSWWIYSMQWLSLSSWRTAFRPEARDLDDKWPSKMRLSTLCLAVLRLGRKWKSSTTSTIVFDVCWATPPINGRVRISLMTNMYKYAVRRKPRRGIVKIHAHQWWCGNFRHESDTCHPNHPDTEQARTVSCKREGKLKYCQI